MEESKEKLNEIDILKEQIKVVEADLKKVKASCEAVEKVNKSLNKRLSDAATLVRKYTYSIRAEKKDVPVETKVELADDRLNKLMHLLEDNFSDYE